MCTVTVLSGASLLPVAPASPPVLRVAFNRDELRSRGPALPPAERLIETRRVLMPIDSDAGGTWVAANDAGLVFALLNVTRATDTQRVERPGRPAGGAAHGASRQESRGLIIPSIAGCGRLADVVPRLRTIDPARYQPFRLLAMNHEAVVDALSDGEEVRVRHQPLTRPWIRTSSSLGDAHVLVPRTILFRRLFERTPVAAESQDAFHRHQWPGRLHLSVLMSRPDAQTVSITTIEVHETSVTMAYEPVDDTGVPSHRVTRTLPRAGS